MSFASSRIVYPMRLSKGATSEQTSPSTSLRRHRVDASSCPIRPSRPKLLYAGRVAEPAGTDRCHDFLTAYSVTYAGPSRITNDFGFTAGATDEAFQRTTYVTENDGLLSTIAVLLAGMLLLASSAAVIARTLVRRSARP